MKSLRIQKWTIGDAVRLDAEFKTPLGRLPADTPGEVIALGIGPRVRVRFAQGDVWVDQGRLLPAQRTMEELS